MGIRRRAQQFSFNHQPRWGDRPILLRQSEQARMPDPNLAASAAPPGLNPESEREAACRHPRLCVVRSWRLPPNLRDQIRPLRGLVEQAFPQSELRARRPSASRRQPGAIRQTSWPIRERWALRALEPGRDRRQRNDQALPHARRRLPCSESRNAQGQQKSCSNLRASEALTRSLCQQQILPICPSVDIRLNSVHLG